MKKTTSIVNHKYEEFLGHRQVQDWRQVYARGLSNNGQFRPHELSLPSLLLHMGRRKSQQLGDFADLEGINKAFTMPDARWPPSKIAKTCSGAQSIDRDIHNRIDGNQPCSTW